jgi:Fic family protein
VNIYSCAGTFRTGPVFIQDGETIVHDPPPWKEVEGLVDAMCSYVNDNWVTLNPVSIAAYLLWRVNWIHPFFGGNGRTARSIAYLALCAKLGFRMPGKVTIPDHIVKRRKAYIGALRSADKAWEKGTVDVSDMEHLMESVMAAQMLEIMEQATGKKIAE